MKYDEAQLQLKHALAHQKTIRISKLKLLMQSMNISLKQDSDSQEVEYLKREIKKLNKQLRNRRR